MRLIVGLLDRTTDTHTRRARERPLPWPTSCRMELGSLVDVAVEQIQPILITKSLDLPEQQE